jgi:hypothetical protein
MQGSSGSSGSSSSSSSSSGQGSSISQFLQQNGVSVGQFQNALYSAYQQNGGSSINLSQLFQNSSSGQNVNVTA